YAGRDLIATLERGMIEATTTDVFTSEWLPRLFRPLLATERRAPDATPSVADGALVRMIAQHMVRRAVFVVRQAGNGGMILVADPELVTKCVLATSPTLKLKYAFLAGEARERFRHLQGRLVRALEEPGGGRP